MSDRKKQKLKRKANNQPEGKGKKLKKVQELVTKKQPKQKDSNDNNNSLIQDLVKAFATIQEKRADFKNATKWKKIVDEIAASEAKKAVAFAEIVTGIFNHLSESSEDTLDCLNDVSTCWKNSLSDEVHEPHWTDVLLDVIISLLPNAGHHNTKLFAKGMRQLAEDVTVNSLESVMAALTSTQEEDEDESVEEESEDGDEDSEDNENEEQNEESDDVDSEDSEVDENEEQLKSLDEFKLKLQSILSSAEGDNDETNGEDDDDVGIDDDKMLALDDALAEAFRERFSSKKSTLMMKKQESAFKCRVLQVYTPIIEKRESVDFCLPLVPILLELAIDGNPSDGLPSKAISTLNIITSIKAKKDGDDSSSTASQVFDIIIQLTKKSLPEKLQTCLSKLLIWCLKVSEKKEVSTELEQHIREMTVKALEKDHCNKQLLLELSRSHPSIAKVIFETLSSKVFDAAVKERRKSHAAQLLTFSLKGLKSSANENLDSSISSSLWKQGQVVVREILKPAAENQVLNVNPLFLSSILTLLQSLRLHNDQLHLDSKTLEAFGRITKKLKRKLPIDGQKALKSLLKGSEVNITSTRSDSKKPAPKKQKSQKLKTGVSPSKLQPKKAVS